MRYCCQQVTEIRLDVARPIGSRAEEKSKKLSTKLMIAMYKFVHRVCWKRTKISLPIFARPKVPNLHTASLDIAISLPVNYDLST